MPSQRDNLWQYVEPGMQDEDAIWIGQIGMGGREAEAAHKALFLKYRAKLLRFFRHHRMSHEDGDELVQEVFIRVWRKAQDYEGRASVRAWIWSIGHHCMIDLIRKRSGDGPPLALSDDPDSAESQPETPDPNADGRNFDFHLCLKRGVHAFEAQHPERAEAMRLTALGWTTEEISEALERNAGATREYLSQCRKVLEKFISHCRDLLAPSHHDTGGRHG
jgi:RNA polymerase sigma-70 factor, ECF subfamily